LFQNSFGYCFKRSWKIKWYKSNLAFYIENETVFLLAVYDKSEQADISDKELRELLSEIEK